MTLSVINCYDCYESFVTLPVINVKFCVLQEEMRGGLLETQFVHKLPQFSPLNPLRSRHVLCYLKIKT